MMPIFSGSANPSATSCLTADSVDSPTQAASLRSALQTSACFGQFDILELGIRVPEHSRCRLVRRHKKRRIVDASRYLDINAPKALLMPPDCLADCLPGAVWAGMVFRGSSE